MEKKKRRIVLIKKSFQIRFSLIAFFAVIIATFLIGFDIWYNINYRLVKMFELEPELINVLNVNNIFLMTRLVIYAAIILIIAIFISHKLAGPIYRFEQSCEEVGDGNLTYRVKLRNTDELLDLQDKFNLMIDSLQSKVQKIDQICQKASAENNIKAQEVQAEIHKQFILF
ncbi:MAG: HAMP domain-containing protein [bacterium]